MSQIHSPRSALAAAVRDVVAAVEQAGHVNAWDFNPSGPAATDWTTKEQPSGWGPQPLQDAYRTGAIGWYVVVEQALSVADLLDAGRNLGLLAASRALAEAAARSGLLLRTGTAPEVRIRRMINERLHALHEDWRMSADVDQLDSSWQLVTANRLIDVAEHELDLPVRRPDDQRSGWVGERREATMTVLADMLNHPAAAAMFYRNTSAVSHAALHGLAKRLEYVDQPTDTYRARLREVSSTEATVEIQPALAALAIAARALVTQAGWDPSDFESADAALVTITRGLIQ